MTSTLQFTMLSQYLPYRETIELAVSHGRNAMAVLQDLVSQYGFNGGYQTVKRFVRKLSGSEPQAAPGEETQVDYGYVSHCPR